MTAKQLENPILLAGQVHRLVIDRDGAGVEVSAKANTVMVSRIDADAVPQIDGIACVFWLKDEPCRRPVAARIASLIFR